MFTRSTITVLIVLALVGGVDAAGDDQWDLTVIFGGLIAGLAFLLARTSLSRPLVPIRGDLVRWLASRADVHGERPGDVADRAVAAYRDGLTGSPSPPTGDRARPGPGAGP
jgi:hypothetical protein